MDDYFQVIDSIASFYADLLVPSGDYYEVVDMTDPVRENLCLALNYLETDLLD